MIRKNHRESRGQRGLHDNALCNGIMVHFLRRGIILRVFPEIYYLHFSKLIECVFVQFVVLSVDTFRYSVVHKLVHVYIQCLMYIKIEVGLCVTIGLNS